MIPVLWSPEVPTEPLSMVTPMAGGTNALDAGSTMPAHSQYSGSWTDWVATMPGALSPIVTTEPEVTKTAVELEAEMRMLLSPVPTPPVVTDVEVTLTTGE